MRPNLTVVVPVYNEHQTVTVLLERLFSVLQNAHVTYQVIVVDDGSTDGTRELLIDFQERMKESHAFDLLYHTKNQGKGAAIQTAIRKATGEYTVIQDADLEYDPSDIVRLYVHAKNKNLQVLYGSRNSGQNKRGKFLFYWGGRLVTVIANKLFDQKLTDEATCYKLIDTTLLQSFSLHEKGFAFCPEITALIAQKNIQIQEIPVSYTPRSKDHGKKINWRDGLEAIWTLYRLRFPSLAICVLSCSIAVLAFFLYTTTRHRALEGYEGETAQSAIQLFEGTYNILRAGISSVLLYIPFIALLKVLGISLLPNLTIVPLVWSAVTGGLLCSIVWQLTHKKSLSIIVPLLIVGGSMMWPYANIGMEYQMSLYLTLLLTVLLRWSAGRGSLFWPAVVFALVATAKSYGPMFGLPLILFVLLVHKNRSTENKQIAKEVATLLFPAAAALAVTLFFQWSSHGSIAGAYSPQHEFQIWLWWEGFYGVFFSIGKSILLFNPLLLLVLFRWKKFFNDHKETAAYILTSFVLLLLITAPFSYWSDETLSVRKLVPIIGLLHLPLIYFFQKIPSWRSIKTWGMVSLIVLASYIQILGASYYYGKSLSILRKGNVDSLQHMRFIPKLSVIPLHHTLLTGYLFDADKTLTYTEPTWFRWHIGDPDIVLVDATIPLKDYQTPDILWLQQNKTHLFLGLVAIDVLLLSYAVFHVVKSKMKEI